MKTVFFQMTRHTDSEITFFLQKQAECGLWLKKVKGNRFVFEEKPYDGKRICAVTFYSHGHETSTELQAREEIVYLRSTGWDCICIGTVENIKDSRRHLFLYEEIKGSKIPESDKRSEKRAELRGKFKAISNTLLCLLFGGLLTFLLSDSLIKVVTNNFYLCCTLFFAFALSFCTVISLISLIKSFIPFKTGKFLRSVDISTITSFAMLVLLAFFLLADSLYGNGNSSSDRVKVGSSTYRIYKDEIPVSLEDVNGDISGSYRTKRKTESRGTLSSYTHCFDESFGVLSGENIYDSSKAFRVSFLSYTFFSSESEKLRNAISSQLMDELSQKDDSLSDYLNIDSAYRSLKGNRILLIDGNNLAVIKSGFDITDDNLRKFAELL